MGKRFKFTTERIKKLPVPGQGKRAEYQDTEQVKLRLRVTGKGAKTFAVLKKVEGKAQRITIGKFPDISIDKARKEAQKILGDLVSGVDVQAKKRKEKAQSKTLKQIFDHYLDHHTLKPGTVADYRKKFRHFEKWNKKPVSEITERMVMQKQRAITKESGQTTANTTMRVLRLLMRYAVAIGSADSNPTEILSTARLWHKDKRKDRIIPQDKLKAWYQAVLGVEDARGRVYLLLLIHMGLRMSEALSLRWSEVDLKSK
ncbi:MAG: integrase arm-type DNA-binding domain-containing protein, partial [Sedimenticola sp.]